MTKANAIKKLEKAGFTVEKIGHEYVARSDKHPRLISFLINGSDDSITCIRTRMPWDKDEIESDYCGGTWCDNITQAIRLSA